MFALSTLSAAWVVCISPGAVIHFLQSVFSSLQISVIPWCGSFLYHLPQLLLSSKHSTLDCLLHPKFSRAICSVLLLHIQCFSLAWMLILLQLTECCCLCDVHPTQDLWYLICLRFCYSIDEIQRLLKRGFSTLLSL